MRRGDRTKSGQGLFEHPLEHRCSRLGVWPLHRSPEPASAPQSKPEQQRLLIKLHAVPVGGFSTGTAIAAGGGILPKVVWLGVRVGGFLFEQRTVAVDRWASRRNLASFAARLLAHTIRRASWPLPWI